MDAKDFYSEIIRVLRATEKALIESGVPRHEIPPAIADFTVMSIIEMCEQKNIELAEEALEAIMERMTLLLKEYKAQEK